MGLFFREKHDPVFCNPLHRVLGVFWAAGLVCGACVCVYAGDSLVSTMRAAPNGCVSIPGLLSVLLLPLLFSAFAVYICQIRLLFPIVFVKAFCFAFVAMAVDSAFAAAGWLVRLLLLFGSGASLPVLWWFWCRSVDRESSHILADFVMAIVTIAGIASVDYWFIAPFLRDLIAL